MKGPVRIPPIKGPRSDDQQRARELDADVNLLSEQLRIIELDTPQYWYDPKTGKVTTEAPASDTAIPILGYIDEKDKKKAEQLVKNIYAKQSDGILSDYYAGQEHAGKYNTKQKKAARLEESRRQRPSDYIEGAYPNIPVFTEEYVEKLKQEQRDPEKTGSHSLFDAKSWLLVRMPDHFDYTGAILRGCHWQGLLHTLLRHSAEWWQVIPGFQNTLREASPFVRRSVDIIGAATIKNVKRLLMDFGRQRQQQSDSTGEDLSDLQMQIYQFLVNNVTNANYLGEGMNDVGRQQVFFEVKDINGKPQVMVVCVSEQLYYPDEDFNDHRPIRTITTVFFVSKSVFNARFIKKLF